MTAIMGSQAEGRIHQLLGARYLNCTPPAGAGNTSSHRYGEGYGGMGPGMMGGDYYGNGGWDSMMGSRDWSWMMGGAWQNLNRQGWQRLQQQLLGTTTSNTHNGTSEWMIATIALAALLLGAAIAIFAVRRRPFRRRPTTQP
ncbi:MAG: hypothetical protein ACYCXW_23770 [Solirubrobacteraceae bacterium]